MHVSRSNENAEVIGLPDPRLGGVRRRGRMLLVWTFLGLLLSLDVVRKEKVWERKLLAWFKHFASTLRLLSSR